MTRLGLPGSVPKHRDMSTQPQALQLHPQERRRLTVTGVVQGVGFRPFVYGLAQEHGLTGFVGNDSQGVFIEVEGPPQALDAFRRALEEQAPPLAHIEGVAVEAIPARHDATFTIVHSQAQPAASTLVSPDVCICDDCLGELFDPQDRRYRYPFINCTNCGPRFTIIRDIPYDRPLTTMADFVMCPACQAEYDDPGDRRFHAQPNACPECGPQVWLEGADGRRIPGEPIQTAQALLAQGRILAVKGLGGFHLACDATQDAVLARLRERKGRVDKPFAVMARDLAQVRRVAHLSPQEEALLTGRERPILLLAKREPSPLSPLVAPGNRFLGVMLPYTPLHYLLLTGEEGQAPPILVMTSGNHSDEPIVTGNQEARERLAGLADAFLMHDRPIHARCDDSVVRIFQGVELPVRRSRGYAPFPVKLPWALPSILAVGGELKSTFCLTKGPFAFMSQHIGDMENLETLVAFGQAVAHFQHIFRAEPVALACDLHPGYLSTRWAQEHAGERPLVQVQHHHAHIAACMAEHGLEGQEPVIGFSFDGTGYGPDGAIWGGEVLVADYRGYRRAAHLAYTPLPGGDAGVKRPYRMALAHLRAAGVDWQTDLPPVAACPPPERRILVQQLARGIQTVPTSSMGRLFDAVAALAGVRQQVTYEAQAAMELEALAAPEETGCYAFARAGDIFHAGPVIQAIVADLRAGVPVEVIAARFHNGVARLILELARAIREETGLGQVALSGGVFQNVTLLERSVALLRDDGFQVLTHRQVPPNDGGLALGQAVVAAHRMDD